MKRRIEQLANGIYEYERPEILFSSEREEASVRRGENYVGSFTLHNSQQKRMRGFLYSSDARVACEPKEFSGIETKITFEADFCGMQPGDVLEGEFVVCADVGTASLPFRFTVKERGRQPLAEFPEDLDAFTAMAQKDYHKAYTLFCSDAFGRMIKKRYPEYAALYEGLMGHVPRLENMEEFLTAAEKKKPVSFRLKEKERSFQALKASSEEYIELYRMGWGFRVLDIVSDAAFLKPAHARISTEDFIGSSFRLAYLIDADQLHAGNNYGRIRICSQGEILEYEVLVKSVRERGEEHSIRIQQKQVERLYTDYIAFRLKHIPLNIWIARAEEAFAQYEQAGGTNVMVKLYQAQVHFAADRPREACTLLELLNRKHLISDQPSVQGYYQYLTTFYDKEPVYIDYVEEKISELFLKHQENWVLQWLLLCLDKNLAQHPVQKLEAIRGQYIRGCRSRLMYLEAYTVFQKSPLLLKKLDDFEIQVLRFMCRNDLLDKEIAMQAADIAGRKKHYDDALYHILCHCHVRYASRSVVSAICSLLMKGHKTGEEYFNWYEKGVSLGLRLTGLYEYYVESMGTDRGGLLPQMIRMYFTYHNTALNYEKKAVLYANIIENKDADRRTYDNYRPAMEKFVADQLMAGHISRKIAGICREFLNKGMMNRRMAENLTRALYTYEIRCDSKEAVSVAVVHRQLKEVRQSSLTDGMAQVRIYSDDAWIFLIDRAGRWHAGTIPYTVTKILDAEDLFSMCRELAPDGPGFLLHFCAKAQQEKAINGDNIRDFCRLLEFDDIREEYKRQIRQDILDYYYENQADESLYEYLHLMDAEAFIQTDKRKTIELMVSQGMCREAFALTARYGPEKIGFSALVRLCSRTILEYDREKNDMLLYLCEYCFRKGTYDEIMLSYLLAEYDGPIEQMKALWHTGKQFELDTFVLEEKILLMLLFTREGMENTEEIFESYRRRLGRKILLNGYLNLMSYEYFVKNRPVAKPVFDETARRMEREQNLDLVCRLALLKYDSQNLPDERRRKRMKRILQECGENHLYFAFFSDLEPELLRQEQLQERIFVEYRTHPGARVMLKYTVENPEGEVLFEHTEQMKDIYEGIHVKDFTLFYGERLDYTITEEKNGRIEKKETHSLTAAMPQEEDEGISRFQMLNQMCCAFTQHRESMVKSEAVRYLELERIAERLFPIT